MSFRSSTAKVGNTGYHTNADQPREINGTRRGQDVEVGGTAAKRSTRFRISAAVTEPEDTGNTSYASQTQSQAQAQARRPPPSAFTQPGMSNDEQDTTQNAAPRTFLQTRRRQPSTNTAKLPLGPRPNELQQSTGSNISRCVYCDFY